MKNEYWILIDSEGQVLRSEAVGPHNKHESQSKIIEVVEYSKVKKLVESIEEILGEYPRPIGQTAITKAREALAEWEGNERKKLN